MDFVRSLLLLFLFDQPGDFHTKVRRLVSARDLENNTHVWTIYLDITWPHGLKPLFISAQPENLLVKDDRDAKLKPISHGTGRLAITRPQSIEMPIRVTAPGQPSQRISLLSGTFTIFGAKRTLEFTFELDKDKQPSQSQDGVVVGLHEFKQTKAMWTVRVQLTYPPDTPDFESFESWLGNNEMFLERKDGKSRFAPNGGYSIDDTTGKTAILTYRFLEDKNLSLGKPADWKLVYRTPGKIEKLPVRFEFKDLPAP